MLIEEVVEKKYLNDEDVAITEEIYENVYENNDLLDATSVRCLGRVEEVLEKLFATYRNYRTANYWIRYIQYVGIIKQYIQAERTGDWNLHLATVSKMLNLFAATGHLHYTKSARMYLQQMLHLPTTNPTLYREFIEHGYHTIRRSDRYWAGLWSDLAIEQFDAGSKKLRRTNKRKRLQ